METKSGLEVGAEVVEMRERYRPERGKRVGGGGEASRNRRKPPT